MQNTFSQSGNDSKWFSKKSLFRIGRWNSRHPPFMEKNILNFHFDYLNTSLSLCTLFLVINQVAKSEQIDGLCFSRKVKSVIWIFKWGLVERENTNWTNPLDADRFIICPSFPQYCVICQQNLVATWFSESWYFVTIFLNAMSPKYKNSGKKNLLNAMR